MLLLELCDFCLFSPLNETERSGGLHRRCMLLHEPYYAPNVHMNLHTALIKAPLGGHYALPAPCTAAQHHASFPAPCTAAQHHTEGNTLLLWGCAALCPHSQPTAAQGSVAHSLHKAAITDGQIWPAMFEGSHTAFFFSFFSFFSGGKPATHGEKHPIASSYCL